MVVMVVVVVVVVLVVVVQTHGPTDPRTH